MPARRTLSSSGANAYNTPPNSPPTKNHSPPRGTRSKRGSQRNGVSDSDGGGSSSNSPKYTAYLRERSYDDLNDSNPFAREEAFLRAMSESDIWASALAPQNSIDSVYSDDGNDINPFITNLNGDDAIGSRDINNIGVDRKVPPSISTINTTTNIFNQRNPLLWISLILLGALMMLFVLSIFENPIKVQLWPVNNTVYRIQPAGENEDGSSDIEKGGKGDGGGILFTMDDLKKLIMAEVSSCMENGANAPSIGPSSNNVRDLITKEVKRELSAQRFEIPKLRGKFNIDTILEITRRETMEIVNEKLLVFSQDTLNLPDFALHSGGAKVISALTSKTYEVWPEKWYSKLFAHMSGQGILRGKPPVTAISPETHVGQCWPFPGEQGQLAIWLNRRVYVNAVTYDHVSKDVAIEVMSAPKDFEVWGIVDDGGKDKPTANNELEEVEDELFLESTEVECGVREDGQYISGHENNEDVSSNSDSKAVSDLDPSLGFRLGSFTYDINGLPVQTFNVSPEILKQNKPIRAIIMKVKSNWGEPSYTCLYRFRVHGEPAANRVTTRDT